MRIALTVNGRPVEAEVAPRTSLADFLREHLLLTGTHLGCEHGICGACTVEIGGEIARSCITCAVACDGARVRTIEGFDDDPLMARLRRAFTEAHALQCGFCTPGMLIAACDLVRRREGLARPEIRTEMSGNLCRCTGYMGIVDAIERVMRERGQTPGASASDTTSVGGQGSDPMSDPAPWLGPAPGPAPDRGQTPSAIVASMTIAGGQGSDPARTPRPSAVRVPVHVATGSLEETDGAIRLSQSFTLEHPRDVVWALMSDPEAVARCLPGARLDGPEQNGRLTGHIEVALGPIAARFAGEGTLTRFPAEFRQVIEGRGTDRRGGSRVAGSIDYRLSAVGGKGGGEATRVDAVISYTLTGLLAQLGRSGLARDLARRLGEAFAGNIDAHLRDPAGTSLRQTRFSPRISALSLVLQSIADRLRALFERLLRRP